MESIEIDCFENYQAMKKLKGGAMGKTFLVKKLISAKLCVLKKVDYLEEEDKIRADREVEQMIRLASPYTVRLISKFPRDQELCLIMEYCSQGDLRKVIAELQQLPEEERLMRVWEILVQIFLALDHLHSHDVIHRDVKPENIFVMEDGTIKLGDFGLAKEIASRNYATAVGTKVYQAPEVYKQQQMTVESDVFAVGEVIFELLSGRHPFESDSEQGMINNIIQGKMIEFPTFAEGNMKQIVFAMMNPNPSRRPSAKAVLAHDMVRMYLRQHQGKRNIDDSGRIQQLQQERDDERRRADEQKIRADSAEQKADEQKIRADSAEQRADQQRRRADEAEEVSRVFQLEIENKNREIQTLQQRTQIIEQEKDREKIRADQEKVRSDQEKVRADEQEGNVTQMNLQLTQKNSIIQQMTEKQLETEALLPPKNEEEDLTELGPINQDAVIPDYATVQQNENKFIHTKDNDNYCTIAFNPIISKGVIRFEGFFENIKEKIFAIGIADVSAVFGPNQAPNEDANFTKTIGYQSCGQLNYFGVGIHGNCKFEDKQLVALEVNMSSNPRTLHFFVDNQEQPVSVSDIPPNIRFFVFLIDPEQSFTLTRFERIQSSTARGVEGSRVLKWGYDWDENADYDGNLVQLLRNSLEVNNISQDTTEQEVQELFQTVGRVKTIYLSYPNEQSVSQGFVQMSNEESALRAMNELNGHELNGHRIQILKANLNLLQILFQQKSNDDSENESSSENDGQMISNRLFIANLNFSTTGQDLGNFFAQIGYVEKAEVIIHNGRSKGFGFVTMRNQELAQRALNQLNNCKLDGRNIGIQFAKEHDDHNPHQNSNFRGERRYFNQTGNSRGERRNFDQRGRFPSRRRFRPR